ncbi:MAG: cytochrome [Mycobacterium sp.]|nr:cytochrome [Mycobacterium sp.]
MTTTHAVEFNPYDYETFCDPYPTYRRLREETPVYHNEQLNFWALARYADVLAAHNDWENYSSAGGVTIEGTERDSPFLIVKDPPEHRWHRKIIGKVMTPRRILALEPFIRARCGELLDRYIGEPEFDVAGNFAVLLPLDVISELIGIPVEMREEVHVKSDLVAARGDDARQDAAMVAALELYELYLGLVKERRTHPRDDIITVLMETEVDDDDGKTRRMSDEEVAFRFYEMGFAGHETVAKGIPNGLIALTKFPGEKARLLADPSLYASAAEEILRYDPPSQLQGRTTTKDVTLHDVTIPAGEKVMLITGSALRDERAYDEADRFDITRQADPSTLFFGYGIHRCIGAHLARLEIKIAFEETLQRFPNFVVDESRAERKISTNVRGVAHLPLLTAGDA